MQRRTLLFVILALLAISVWGEITTKEKEVRNQQDGQPVVTNFSFSKSSVQFGDTFTIQAAFDLYYRSTNGFCSLILDYGNTGTVPPQLSDFKVTACSHTAGGCTILTTIGAKGEICACTGIQGSSATTFEQFTATLQVNTSIRASVWPFELICENDLSYQGEEDPIQSINIMQPHLQMGIKPSIQNLQNVTTGTAFSFAINVTNSGTGIFEKNIVCTVGGSGATGVTFGGSGGSSTCSITSTQATCTTTAANLAAGSSEQFTIPLTYTAAGTLGSFNVSCVDQWGLFTPQVYLFAINSPLPTPTPTPSPAVTTDSSGSTSTTTTGGGDGGSTTTGGDGGSTTTGGDGGSTTTGSAATTGSSDKLMSWLNMWNSYFF